MIPTVLAVLAALAGPVPDRVPEAVRAGTTQAVARIRAVRIEGKFGEYGDRVHVTRFDAAGDPTAVEGKFIRLAIGVLP
ncbi:hypothetical protein [Deferrisoma sp.]